MSTKALTHSGPERLVISDATSCQRVSMPVVTACDRQRASRVLMMTGDDEASCDLKKI
jgi:hypothetical protein